MADRGKANLDDDFAAFKQTRLKVRCYACKLDPALLAWVDEQCRNDEPAAAIAEFLTKLGYEVGTSAIVSHRKNHVRS